MMTFKHTFLTLPLFRLAAAFSRSFHLYSTAWVVSSREFGGGEAAWSTCGSVKSCSFVLLRSLFLGFAAPSIFLDLHLRLVSTQTYIPNAPAEDSENKGR